MAVCWEVTEILTCRKPDLTSLQKLITDITADVTFEDDRLQSAGVKQLIGHRYTQLRGRKWNSGPLR